MKAGFPQPRRSSTLASLSNSAAIWPTRDMPSRAPPLGKPKGGPVELPREEAAPDLLGDVDPGFNFDQSCSDDS